MDEPRPPSQQSPAQGDPAPEDPPGGPADLAPIPFESLELLARSILVLVRERPELSAACRAVGNWLASIAESGEAPDLEVRPDDHEAALRAEEVTETVERLLNIGGAKAPVQVLAGGEAVDEPPAHAIESKPALPREFTADPPDIIIKRCRLKAECCRWALERKTRMDNDADYEQYIRPIDGALLERARHLPDCWLWPLDLYSGPLQPEDQLLDNAAGCYESLADAMELAERVRADDEVFEEYGQRSYELLAACCSATRKVLLDCEITRDVDQDDSFHWLRTRTQLDQIFVAHHMKLSDPADPTDWSSRCDEVSRITRELDQRNADERDRRRLLEKVHHISMRWSLSNTVLVMSQAKSLDESLQRLAELGVRPSDTRIRASILKIADDIPEDFEPSSTLRQALRFADEFAARLENEQRPPSTVPPPPTPAVQDARRLLEGRAAVLIGGKCRHKSRDALRDGLGLSELIWESTKPHQSVSSFEAQIRRPEVALVMLAIRWASHSFEGVKPLCEKAGKAYVRLPAGYNLNQVAEQIMAQVSDQLSGE